VALQHRRVRQRRTGRPGAGAVPKIRRTKRRSPIRATDHRNLTIRQDRRRQQRGRVGDAPHRHVAAGHPCSSRSGSWDGEHERRCQW